MELTIRNLNNKTFIIIIGVLVVILLAGLYLGLSNAKPNPNLEIRISNEYIGRGSVQSTLVYNNLPSFYLDSERVFLVNFENGSDKLNFLEGSLQDSDLSWLSNGIKSLNLEQIANQTWLNKNYPSNALLSTVSLKIDGELVSTFTFDRILLSTPEESDNSVPFDKVLELDKLLNNFVNTQSMSDYLSSEIKLSGYLIESSSPNTKERFPIDMKENALNIMFYDEGYNIQKLLKENNIFSFDDQRDLVVYYAPVLEYVK